MWEHNSEWHFNHAQMSFLYSSLDPFEIQFEICCCFFSCEWFQERFQHSTDKCHVFHSCKNWNDFMNIAHSLQCAGNLAKIDQQLLEKLNQMNSKIGPTYFIPYSITSFTFNLHKRKSIWAFVINLEIRTFSLHSICFSSKSQINW